jgi:hypothetical protein
MRDGGMRTGAKPARLFRHPLSGADPAVIRSALAEFAARNAEGFPKILDKLLHILRDTSPLHTLTIIAGWGQQFAVSDAGVSTKSLIDGIEQHHIELLQACVLKLHQEEWGYKMPYPSDIQNTIDIIRELADSFRSEDLRWSV